MLGYTKGQILSEDEHTRYIYDGDDGCGNVIVRRIEKKESPGYLLKYRKEMFTITLHSKTKSCDDIDFGFITDSLSARLRYDFKEERFSTDSLMYIHDMKFYNNKHKLYKDQEKMRDCYRMFIENALLTGRIVWQYKEIIQFLKEKICEYKKLCRKIPYKGNEEIFDKLHTAEYEKEKNERELKELLESEKDLHISNLDF